jgi:hypothetical protein
MMFEESETTSIKEFMTECELFPYSIEYFEFVKEGYKLELMRQYLKSQYFILDNPELIEESANVLTESYLMESVSNESLEAFEEKFADKFNTWKAKVIILLKRILDVLVTFWGKLIEKYNNIQERIKKIDAAFHKLNAAEREKLNMIVSEIQMPGGLEIKSVGTGAPIWSYQIFHGGQIFQSEMHRSMSAVFGSRFKAASGKCPFALSVAQVKTLVARIPAIITEQGDRIGDMLNGFLRQNQNGIECTNDVAAIQSCVRECKDIRNRMAAIEASARKTGESVKEAVMFVEAGDTEVPIYARVSTAVAQTLTFFWYVNIFRETVLGKIESALKLRQGKKEE